MKFDIEKLEQTVGAALGAVIFAVVSWPVLEYSGVLDKLREIAMQLAKLILGHV